MKKLALILLAVALIFTFASCSKSSSSAAPSTSASAAAAPAAESSSTTPSTGTVDSEYDPNKTVDFTQQTSEENRVVTIGTIDKSLYKQPVFVTSFGQSTDAAMLDTVMKRIGVDYVYNATATADTIKGYKTIIIAVGASTKGLGAAGISEADETARAKAIMEYINANDVEVICCHIGGSARRGTLSDLYSDMVMEKASLIVLKEDANFDYKFTKYAEEHNKPISLIYATKDALTVFTEIFQ
ncbi:MAG: hypothetical protein J5768_02010 [Spirochaetales bacterium]|nr:hypothetical protein [Spirochaetales bacterium]